MLRSPWLAYGTPSESSWSARFLEVSSDFTASLPGGSWVDIRVPLRIPLKGPVGIL